MGDEKGCKLIALFMTCREQLLQQQERGEGAGESVPSEAKWGTGLGLGVGAACQRGMAANAVLSTEQLA